MPLQSDDSLREQVAALLGPGGRMIAASKSDYGREHPNHVVVFNASIWVAPNQRAWSGDLDLTVDEPLLRAVARATGRIVYVLYEHDARDPLGLEPRVVNALYSVVPSGHTDFRFERFRRARDGTLRLRLRRDRCG